MPFRLPRLAWSVRLNSSRTERALGLLDADGLYWSVRCRLLGRELGRSRLHQRNLCQELLRHLLNLPGGVDVHNTLRPHLRSSSWLLLWFRRLQGSRDAIRWLPRLPQDLVGVLHEGRHLNRLRLVRWQGSHLRPSHVASRLPDLAPWVADANSSLSPHIGQVTRLFELLLKLCIRRLLRAREADEAAALQRLPTQFLAHLHPRRSAYILCALQALRRARRRLKNSVLQAPTPMLRRLHHLLST